MALVECLEATLAAPADPRLHACFLEYPRSGVVAESAALEIRGWVIGEQLEAVAVEICDATRVVRRVPVDVQRPDVAAVYPSARFALVSGFYTTMSMRPPEGQRLEFRAVLADQTRVPMASIRVRTRWREQHDARSAPLVSVIIPSFRQAHYLGDAIESALAQTHSHVEIVVVDDGSPDNTGEVAARYPGVRCVRQANAGVSEARNLGIRVSNGAFLVFLDADDRLLPNAVQTGLQCFAEHPEVAFVSGLFRSIGADGGLLYERLGHHVPADHYAEMLRRNYIATPCAVMFRRSVFESMDAFLPSFSVCADYELYLRVLRLHPAWSHPNEVAEYRRYGTGLSSRTEQLLTEALAALRAQRPYLEGDRHLVQAYRTGIRFWKTLAADVIARRVRADWYDGDYKSVLAGLWRLRRCGLVSVPPLIRRGYPDPAVQR